MKNSIANDNLFLILERDREGWKEKENSSKYSQMRYVFWGVLVAEPGTLPSKVGTLFPQGAPWPMIQSSFISLYAPVPQERSFLLNFMLFQWATGENNPVTPVVLEWRQLSQRRIYLNLNQNQNNLLDKTPLQLG